MIGDEVVLLVPVRVQGHNFEFLIDTRSASTALSEDLATPVGLTIDL